MRPISSAQRGSPNWDNLFAVAQSQLGYFTTQQAMAAGYSPQLLHKYLENGKVSRVRRRIYRLVHFPASEHEDLVMLWLWIAWHEFQAGETRQWITALVLISVMTGALIY